VRHPQCLFLLESKTTTVRCHSTRRQFAAQASGELKKARKRDDLPALYKDLLFQTERDAATAGLSRVQLPAIQYLQNARRVHVYHGEVRLP
jgi:hypothetical protein